MEEKKVTESVSSKSNQQTPVKKSNKGCIIAIILLVIGLAVMFSCGFFMFTAMLGSTDISGNGSVGDEIIIKEGGENKAAVINIAGVIYGDQDLSGVSSSGLVTPSQVSVDIDRALADQSVKVIILNIESPGGEAVASDIIYKKVIEASQKKPVIAYSASIAASGGYYIAAGADEIMMHPGVITGSIGVIMQTSSFEGLYEKLGIENATFKSDRFKDNEEIFDEDPEGQLDQIYQTLVDETYDQFVKAIVDGRGMEESLVRTLGDGRIYSGKQALDNGLIDSIGYYDDLYEKAEDLSGTNNLTIVEYNHFDFFSSLFGVQSPVGKLLSKDQDTEYGVKMYYLLSL